MSLRRLLPLVAIAALLATAGLTQAERAIFPSDLYQRTHYYHGQPPTFPPVPQHKWYKWGYFGAYPVPRTHVGGHYGHRDHYREIRFSAPR